MLLWMKGFSHEHIGDDYEGFPKSVQPFWISLEVVSWPWCSLAASQTRPYCASVNSRPPMGLVSRQWDAVDWVCVLCDRRIHKDRASRSASTWQCACPFYSSCAGFFGEVLRHPDLSAPLQPRFGSVRLLAFPKAEISIEMEEICEFNSHSSQAQSTASHCRQTSPTESDCSRMHSKVSSDWLPSYVKATWPVLEIFKMAGYFPDSSLIVCDMWAVPEEALEHMILNKTDSVCVM
jgi:hypothetical protein